MKTEVLFTRRTLTEQVAESLRELIGQNRLSENSRLPNSRKLAQRYRVSHNVMLKALQQLYEEDVIFLPSKRSGYHVKQ